MFSFPILATSLPQPYAEKGCLKNPSTHEYCFLVCPETVYPLASVFVLISVISTWVYLRFCSLTKNKQWYISFLRILLFSENTPILSNFFPFFFFEVFVLYNELLNSAFCSIYSWLHTSVCVCFFSFFQIRKIPNTVNCILCCI